MSSGARGALTLKHAIMDAPRPLQRGLGRPRRRELRKQPLAELLALQEAMTQSMSIGVGDLPT